MNHYGDLRIFEDVIIDGFAGIGTTSPTSKLHIIGAGNTSATRSVLVVNSSAVNSLIIDDDRFVTIGNARPTPTYADTNIYSAYNNAAWFQGGIYIAPDIENHVSNIVPGQIRFGTGGSIQFWAEYTNPTDGQYNYGGVIDSTSQALRIRGGILGMNLIGGSNALLGINVDTNGHVGVGTTADASYMMKAKGASGGGSLAYFETYGGDISMILNNSGYVGIGTAPSYRFHVLENANNYMYYNAVGGEPLTTYTSTATVTGFRANNNGTILTMVAGSGGAAYFDTNAYYDFYTNSTGTHAGRITSSGNWGIGSTTANSKLHVTNTAGELFRLTGTSGTMMNFNGSTGIWTIGTGASAASNDSVVIGANASGGTNREVAIGPAAVASSQGVSIGYSTSTNDRGVAIGYSATNTGSAVSIGESSTAVGGVSIKGTGTGTAHTAIQGSASGAGMGIAIQGLSEGDDSAAIGFRTRATVAGAWAFGRSPDNATYMTNSTANSVGFGWGSLTPTVLFAATADQYIAGTGLLGIGFTTAPAAKVHIRGNSTSDGEYNFITEDSSGNDIIAIRNSRKITVNGGSGDGEWFGIRQSTSGGGNSTVFTVYAPDGGGTGRLISATNTGAGTDGSRGVSLLDGGVSAVAQFTGSFTSLQLNSFAASNNYQLFSNRSGANVGHISFINGAGGGMYLDQDASTYYRWYMVGVAGAPTPHLLSSDGDSWLAVNNAQKLGIGSTDFSSGVGGTTEKLAVRTTGESDTGNHTMAFFENTLTPTVNNAYYQRALTSSIVKQGTFNTYRTDGIFAANRNDGTGAITEMFAANSYLHNSAAATIPTMSNYYSDKLIQGGTITTVASFIADFTGMSAGTVTNVYGLYVKTPVNMSGGTRTNTAGVYIESNTTGSNNWGVYQSGSTMSNHFAGNTLIGATTGSGKLLVKGDGTGTGVNFRLEANDTTRIMEVLDNGRIGINVAPNTGDRMYIVAGSGSDGAINISASNVANNGYSLLAQGGTSSTNYNGIWSIATSGTGTLKAFTGVSDYNGAATNYGGYFSARNGTAASVGVYGIANGGDAVNSTISAGGYMINSSTVPTDRKGLWAIVTGSVNSGQSTGVRIEVDAAGTSATNMGLYSVANGAGAGRWNYAAYLVANGAGANNYALVTESGHSIFNEDGGDYDFRIEGDTVTDLFFVDASTDRIGIGTSAPGSRFVVIAPTNSSIVADFKPASGSADIILEYDTGEALIGMFNTSGTRTISFYTAGDSYVNGSGNFGINTNSPQAKLDVNGSFATRANSPTALTGNTNNYAIPAYSFIRLTNNAAGAINITGATGGVDGRIVVFVNLSTDTISFTNEDTNSTAANRFVNGNAATTKTLSQNDTIEYIYDATTSRWRYKGGSV